MEDQYVYLMYIYHDRKPKASQNGELGLKLNGWAAVRVRVNRDCKTNSITLDKEWSQFNK